MKILRTSLWFSVLVAFLVLIASSAGLFIKSIYARETLALAVQGISQDIVNIAAVVVLLITAYFVNKGSVDAAISPRSLPAFFFAPNCRPRSIKLEPVLFSRLGAENSP